MTEKELQERRKKIKVYAAVAGITFASPFIVDEIAKQTYDEFIFADEVLEMFLNSDFPMHFTCNSSQYLNWSDDKIACTIQFVGTHITVFFLFIGTGNGVTVKATFSTNSRPANACSWMAEVLDNQERFSKLSDGYFSEPLIAESIVVATKYKELYQERLKRSEYDGYNKSFDIDEDSGNIVSQWTRLNNSETYYWTDGIFNRQVCAEYKGDKWVYRGDLGEFDTLEDLYFGEILLYFWDTFLWENLEH